MCKTLKNNVEVVKKSNLKQRLELKLTALVAQNLCPNFQNLAPPWKFRVGGPVVSSEECRKVGMLGKKYKKGAHKIAGRLDSSEECRVFGNQ